MDHKGCNCDWCQDARQIKKGDKFLCTEDVIMDGGRHDSDCAYKSGKTYTSERDGAITDEWGDKEHWWDNWELYFKKLVDKDYFQSITEEYGKQEPFANNIKIMETCANLQNLFVYKNTLYGNSGLEPINVFSKTNAETGILQRVDDKIARIKNSPELRKNDVADLIGYLVLICVSKGWTNFDEFKD